MGTNGNSDPDQKEKKGPTPALFLPTRPIKIYNSKQASSLMKGKNKNKME